jgi:hypothetical protein
MMNMKLIFHYCPCINTIKEIFNKHNDEKGIRQQQIRSIISFKLGVSEYAITTIIIVSTILSAMTRDGYLLGLLDTMSAVFSIMTSMDDIAIGFQFKGYYNTLLN